MQMAIPMVEDTICELGEGTLSPEDEKQIIGRLMADAESQIKEGNMYFIISSRWFSTWENYIGLGDEDPIRQTHFQPNSKIAYERPASIDNSDIIDFEYGDYLDISRALLERRDYVLVPQTVWEKLLMWYGGGPVLARKMISQGAFSKKQYLIEVYPLRLKLIDSRDNSETIIRLSRKATLDELYDAVCTLKRVDKTKASISDYFNKRKQNELNLTNASKTLEKSDLQMDQEILLELKTSKYEFEKELALVPVAPLRSSVPMAGGPMVPSTSTSSENGVDSSNSSEIRGLAGLQNLGNTCFMNSAIQCLVHTPPLAEYFLKDYSDEINSHNPLGMNGKLALAFGDLLRKLWSAGGNVIVPRVFKGKLSQFAPQFSGYNQHDSQELLAFLLDGLHEDLNRVKRKPYMEMKDWSGHPDEQVAQEFWKYHKARNDSVIVDVFQGQYKSTLVCPVCAKISITFDPFMYLSLPLPSIITRSMTLTVFYGDGMGLPMPYTVSVLKHGNCSDLKQAVGVACCLRSDEILLLAEVYDHKIHHFLEDPLEQLSSIKDEEYLVAYRLSAKANGKPKLEIAHKEKPLVESAKYQSEKFFGAPLVSYLEEEVAMGANIEDAVCKMLSPLRRASSVESFVAEDAKSMLQLYFTDERYLTSKPISKDSVVRSGNRVRVVMEWSERERKLYDHSYLSDLPVVYRKASFSTKKTRQESVSLFSCLEAFLKEEPLGPNDMWYCPGCKQHRQASKKLDLWTLPDILVFHLKRFSYSRFFKNKLDTLVDFPVRNLDLTNYVKHSPARSHVYDLYAVSCHYGSLGGGHYTAFSKLIDDDKWYNFDDSRVSPASQPDIRTSAAYVLFYQRLKSL